MLYYVTHYDLHTCQAGVNPEDPITHESGQILSALSVSIAHNEQTTYDVQRPPGKFRRQKAGALPVPASCQ